MRALLAALVLALAAAGPALADEGWVIERFAADITGRPDASLQISGGAGGGGGGGGGGSW